MLQVWFHAVVKAAVGAAHKLFVYAETQVSIVIACMIAIAAATKVAIDPAINVAIDGAIVVALARLRFTLQSVTHLRRMLCNTP